MGGPEMAPQTPPSTSRGGGAGAVLFGGSFKRGHDPFGRGLFPIACVIAVGVVLTFVLGDRHQHRILTLVLLWATMGLAWNVISGYAGQTSFGHQAFFGIGAYVTVLLAVYLKLTPWLRLA